MPRPKKCRRICMEPKFCKFHSLDSNSMEQVILNVDEYEVIRLIDYEKLTQEECAAQMLVARTTITDMYEQARFKIADCIVNGKKLQIQGGNYTVCNEGNYEECYKKCHHHCRMLERKEVISMRIAVPLDENKKNVCPAFGRAPFFLIFDKEENQYEITKNPAADVEGGAGGKVSQFILDSNIDIVITPRCGQNAGGVLTEAGIQIYKTSSFIAKENIEQYLEGKLELLKKFHAGFHGIQ